MVYINNDGRVMQSRPWSFGAVTDMFWGFINLIVLFFQTLINPGLTSKGDNHRTDYRSTGGRGECELQKQRLFFYCQVGNNLNSLISGPPPGGPRRRFGGFGGQGGAAGPP